MTGTSKPAGNVFNRLRTIVATVLGIGYVPLASGTFGSLPGLAAAWALWSLGGEYGTYAVLAGALAVTVAGAWAAGAVVAATGTEDPSQVVVDEFAGQMISLLFLPLTVPVLVAGFLLFRLFDIIKPPPVRQLERLPGAAGIMADDIAAGVYANLLLHAAALLFPAQLGV